MVLDRIILSLPTATMKCIDRNFVPGNSNVNFDTFAPDDYKEVNK